MVSSRCPSRQASAVVLALAHQPATWRYDYELCQRLDLAAGGLYPVLMRLADRGLQETTWEPQVPPGRALAGALVAGRSARPTPARAAGGLGRRPWPEGT